MSQKWAGEWRPLSMKTWEIVKTLTEYYPMGINKPINTFTHSSRF